MRGLQGETAVMTFAPDYQSFEVLDFDKETPHHREEGAVRHPDSLQSVSSR